ncbi:hypothetical protein [Nocardioides insulae]|uniref:hypothetical protein n=1 Tax=Nocardioides insulae TaxID=394734 RepID=UPI00040C63CB|nr:hypothetical protein [Nocardioides insulae]
MNRTRSTLLLAGLLPALILLAFAAKVGLMLGNQSSGDRAYAAGDFPAALEDYDANRRLNVLERWIAPFDAGVAAFRTGDHQGAVARYREALTVVPEDRECVVRINLALAFEALGDDAARSGDRAAAEQHWQAGVNALAEGGCPQDAGSEELTEDSGSVDQRLREKLPPTGQRQPPPLSDPPPPEDETPQEELLEERNERGYQERRDNQQWLDDQRGDPEYSW